MPTQWTRAVVVERCGKCGRAIPVGAPMLRIVLVAVRRFRVRCPGCTDEPLPTDVIPVPVVQPMTVLRRLGYLPLDEREPGSDG